MLVVERVRVLLYRAPLDTKPYLRELVSSLSESRNDRTRMLIEAARPAWVAEVALVLLPDPTPNSENLHVDELRIDLREHAARRIVLLRGLASVATSMGLLGAVLEVIRFLRRDFGLLGLQAGLPQKLALERALVTMALGIATSIIALTALRLFKRSAHTLLRDIDASIEALRPFSSKLDSTAPNP